MIETTGYICSLCSEAYRVKRVYSQKSSARRHEINCHHNPVNHACATCGYWVFDCSDRWRTCTRGFDMATGVSKPIRECTNWKLREPVSGKDDLDE